MATQFYIYKNTYNINPELLKVYALDAQRFVTKSRQDGVTTIHHYDLRNETVVEGKDVSWQSDDRTVYPIPGIAIYNNEFYVNVWIPPAQADPTGLTKVSPKSWLRTFSNSETYPLYLYLAPGETETLEDLTNAVIPTFIPGGETPANYIANNSPRIAYVARYHFDEGIHHEWAHNASKVKEVCLDLHELEADRTALEANAIIRYDNVVNRGRLIIGYIWREMKAVGQDGRKTYAEMDTLIQKLRDDMPDVDHIIDWFSDHNRVLWETYTSDTDTGRQIWTTNDAGSGGELLYDINAAHTDADNTLDSAAAAAEYKNIVIDQYNEAFAFNVSRYYRG